MTEFLKRQGAKLIQDPRVMKIAQDERVMKAMVRAMQARGHMLRVLDEQTGRAARLLERVQRKVQL